MEEDQHTLGLIDTSGHWLNYELEIENPEDDPPNTLVRFMSLEQLMSLLTKKTLHFPRATDYEDPLECVYSDEYCDQAYNGLLESADEPEFSLPAEVDAWPYVERCQAILERRIHRALAPEPEKWFVSCWHSGRIETELLWRAYGGHNGVAMACDGLKLTESIRSGIRCSRDQSDARGDNQNHFDFFHGFVRYDKTQPTIEGGDYGEAPTVRAYSPAFTKNEYFRLDSEYRFAVRLTQDEMARCSADATIDLEACDAQIMTSPLCTPWVSDVIHNIVGDYAPGIRMGRLYLE